MEETQLKELIDTVTGDPIPLNQFSIEDKDPMVILGKINKVEEHLTDIHNLVKSSDAKSTNAVETSQDALTQIETAVKTSNEVLDEANKMTERVNNTTEIIENVKDIKVNNFTENFLSVNDDDIIEKNNSGGFISSKIKPLETNKEQTIIGTDPTFSYPIIEAHNNFVTKTKENLTNVANGLNETINQVNALTPKTITFETFEECRQFIFNKGIEDKLINVKIKAINNISVSATSLTYTSTPTISVSTSNITVFNSGYTYTFVQGGANSSKVLLIGSSGNISNLFVEFTSSYILVRGEDLNFTSFTKQISEKIFSDTTLLTADNYGTAYIITANYYD